MNPTAIEVWVRTKKTRESGLNLLFAVLSLVAGLVVLFFTFWFTYAIICFGWWGIAAVCDLVFGKRLAAIPHEWRLIISGLFLVLLFFQHFWTDPQHWGDYPQRNYVSAPVLQSQAGVVGALGFMLAYPGASANMIADILLVGPRLITGSWRLWKQSRRLSHLDETACAQLLAFLMGRPSAVPYEELGEAGWEVWFNQIRCFDGVVFLEKGITLSSELRNELNTQ